MNKNYFSTADNTNHQNVLRAHEQTQSHANITYMNDYSQRERYLDKNFAGQE